MTKEEMWNQLVSRLGFDSLALLRIHHHQSPEQWVEILCATITKETPNAG